MYGKVRLKRAALLLLIRVHSEEVPPAVFVDKLPGIVVIDFAVDHFDAVVFYRREREVVELGRVKMLFRGDLQHPLRREVQGVGFVDLLQSLLIAADHGVSVAMEQKTAISM